MKNEFPPFYVGQKVVAIEDHTQGFFNKGDEFTVYSIEKNCCGYKITIGIPKRKKYSFCSFCNKEKLIIGNQSPFNARKFTPITSTFQAITYKEVIKQEQLSIN